MTETTFDPRLTPASGRGKECSDARHLTSARPGFAADTSNPCAESQMPSLNTPPVVALASPNSVGRARVSGHGRRDPLTGCTERIEVRCTRDFKWQIEQAAGELHVTPAKLVRLAVLAYLTRVERDDDLDTDEEAAEEAMHASPVAGSMPVGRLHGPCRTSGGWLARLHPSASDDEAREALEAVAPGERVTVVRGASVVLAWTIGGGR